MLRQRLREFVSQNRVGLWGPRPFGSRAPVAKAGGATQQASGARLRQQGEGPSSKLQPLRGVFQQVKAWLEKERQYGHEVRAKHVAQRLRYQLEFERDKQLVYKETSSEKFQPRVYEACERRLALVSVHTWSKAQESWFSKVVFPAIGGASRTPQRMTQQNPRLDESKAHLTWASVDKMIQLVATGSREELQCLVQDTEAFVASRRETNIVVIDETALWLKLRGEEKVILSQSEVDATRDRRNLRKKIKRLQEEAQRRGDVYEAGQGDDVGEAKSDMVRGFYQSGGDKHRLTLVNLAYVKNWFKPEAKVEWGKPKCILLVFSSQHVRAEDIDDEHKFIRDVSYWTSEGWVHFKAGQKTRLLYGYIEARARCSDPALGRELLVWGQPKAWADTQICIWIAELLQRELGQCLVVADCLQARWSEQSLLAHWMHQQILVPYAPDSTSYLQEPDTHEHAQLKAIIKEVKAETRFDLEAEAKNQKKQAEALKWGPHEYVYLCSKALRAPKKKPAQTQGKPANGQPGPRDNGRETQTAA